MDLEEEEEWVDSEEESDEDKEGYIDSDSEVDTEEDNRCYNITSVPCCVRGVPSPFAIQ